MAETTYCIDCDRAARGSTCDLCNEPLCAACIAEYGVAVCDVCDGADSLDVEDDGSAAASPEGR